jgi:hypothetical protein
MVTTLGWVARQWWRGVRVLGRTWAAINTAVATTILLLNPVLGILDGKFASWPLQIALVLVYAIIAVPLLVAMDSSRGLDPVERCRQQLKRVETDIDRLAGKVGVAWDGTLLARIDQLLNDGNKDKAYKVYHQDAGVTWDVAWETIDDWPNTRLERKVAAISGHLETRICA